MSQRGVILIGCCTISTLLSACLIWAAIHLIAMLVTHVKTIEIGIRGQNITVRGSNPEDRYGGQELEMELVLARELHRLLGRLIPLAEKSRLPAPVVALQSDKDAAS